MKCPLPELQDLLNPELLDKALSEMDTDDDGTISKDEWTEAVGKSLTKLLDERQKDRTRTTSSPSTSRRRRAKSSR